MLKEEVIRLFIKNGYQLSKTALPLVLSDPEQIILELGKLKPRPLFVTEKHIKGLSVERTTNKPKILKEYKIINKELKIEDYVKNLHSLYEKIRDILSKRMDKEKLISINKISEQKTFSIIGIVREKRENNILVEDPSGETSIFFDGLMKETLEEICLDDVVGIRCKKIKDKTFARSIIYPDILSSRKITKTEDDIEVIVVSNPSSLSPQRYQKLLETIPGVKKLSTVFLFNETINEKLLEDFSGFNPVNISQNSNPTLFQINGVKILTLPRYFFKKLPDKANSINFMVSILKRRSLFTNYSFILDEIPDIVISNLEESGYKNYKGTSTISNSDPDKVFLVNLKTREVKEMMI